MSDLKEAYDKLFAKYEEEHEKRITAENDLASKKREIQNLKRVQWKVLPRRFIDDVEALYDTEYQNNNPNPYFQNFPRDPRAQRIKRRMEKWKWFIRNLRTSPKIDDIIREAEIDFRKLNNIALHVKLSRHQLSQFNQFLDKLCAVIGEVHEVGSFVILGDAAVQLFEGELEQLHVFGANIDPFLVPMLRALVPIVNPNIPIAVFNP